MHAYIYVNLQNGYDKKDSYCSMIFLFTCKIQSLFIAQNSDVQDRTPYIHMS